MTVARSMQVVRTGLAEEKTHSPPRLPRYGPPLSAIISTDTIYFDNHLDNLVYTMTHPIVRLHTQACRAHLSPTIKDGL
jgi:hypothetical protein